MEHLRRISMTLLIISPLIQGNREILRTYYPSGTSYDPYLGTDDSAKVLPADAYSPNLVGYPTQAEWGRESPYYPPNVDIGANIAATKGDVQVDPAAYVRQQYPQVQLVYILPNTDFVQPPLDYMPAEVDFTPPGLKGYQYMPYTPYTDQLQYRSVLSLDSTQTKKKSAVPLSSDANSSTPKQNQTTKADIDFAKPDSRNLQTEPDEFQNETEIMESLMKFLQSKPNFNTMFNTEPYGRNPIQTENNGFVPPMHHFNTFSPETLPARNNYVQLGDLAPASNFQNGPNFQTGYGFQPDLMQPGRGEADFLPFKPRVPGYGNNFIQPVNNDFVPNNLGPYPYYSKRAPTRSRFFQTTSEYYQPRSSSVVNVQTGVDTFQPRPGVIIRRVWVQRPAQGIRNLETPLAPVPRVITPFST